MSDPNQNYNNNQNMNPNQSLDYDQWVNSLGNIQDGIFQNTPLSNNTGFNSLNQPQSSGINNNNNNILNSTSFSSTTQDLNLDLFFNSPERFYRDIINESPIVSKTPQVGRTPLKNLNINFSTPNFLKNIETNLIPQTSATKNFTPLKNQLFNSNSKLEVFETPQLNKHNSTTLNSSPTTIKISSSAMKNDENSNGPNGGPSNGRNKMIPPSPTPTSKTNNLSHQVKPVIPPSIPKMGCFKKNNESENQTNHKKSNSNNNNNNNKFQIIMTDVNTFANNSKNPKPKKKKLARSSTSIGTASNSISKKTSLKRSASQPQAKLLKTITPNKSEAKQLETSIPTTNPPNITTTTTTNSQKSSSTPSGTPSITPISTTASSSSENLAIDNVQNLFNEEKILSDTEKLLNDDKYF